MDIIPVPTWRSLCLLPYKGLHEVQNLTQVKKLSRDPWLVFEREPTRVRRSVGVCRFLPVPGLLPRWAEATTGVVDAPRFA
jgi:hypothetical protein